MITWQWEWRIIFVSSTIIVIVIRINRFSQQLLAPLVARKRHMLGSCSFIWFYEMAKIVPLPTILALNAVGSCVDLQQLKRSKRLESWAWQSHESHDTWCNSPRFGRFLTVWPIESQILAALAPGYCLPRSKEVTICSHAGPRGGGLWWRRWQWC